jgi:hypothetical protein
MLSELVPWTACASRVGLVFQIVWLPTQLEIELPGRACHGAAENPGVSRKREWNLSKFIDAHSGGDRYCHYLGNVYRSLANDVTAQNFMRCAVDDQLAKTRCSPVDDRPRGRVESWLRHCVFPNIYLMTALAGI